MKSTYKIKMEELSIDHPISSMILYFFMMLGSLTIIKDISLLFNQIAFERMFEVYFTSFFTAVFMVIYQRMRSRKSVNV